MAYVLAGMFRRAGGPPGPGAAVPLPQGFELLRVSDPDGGRPAVSGFDRLTEDVVAEAERLSAGGRVAYVEAEFFGGQGSQAAIGWEDGLVAFGPRLTQTPGEDRDGFEPVEAGDDMAISEALLWLGVEPDPGRDAFDTLGLGVLDEYRVELDEPGDL